MYYSINRIYYLDISTLDLCSRNHTDESPSLTSRYLEQEFWTSQIGIWTRRHLQIVRITWQLVFIPVLSSGYRLFKVSWLLPCSTNSWDSSDYTNSYNSFDLKTFSSRTHMSVTYKISIFFSDREKSFHFRLTIYEITNRITVNKSDVFVSKLFSKGLNDIYSLWP